MTVRANSIPGAGIEPARCVAPRDFKPLRRPRRDNDLDPAPSDEAFSGFPGFRPISDLAATDSATGSKPPLTGAGNRFIRQDGSRPDRVVRALDPVTPMRLRDIAAAIGEDTGRLGETMQSLLQQRRVRRTMRGHYIRIEEAR